MLSHLFSIFCIFVAFAFVWGKNVAFFKKHPQDIIARCLYVFTSLLLVIGIGFTSCTLPYILHSFTVPMPLIATIFHGLFVVFFFYCMGSCLYHGIKLLTLLEKRPPSQPFA